MVFRGEQRGDQLSAIREYIGGTVENCIPMRGNL